MAADLVPEPGVVAAADVDQQSPEPVDCLPPGEEPIVAVSLSPGWVAVTDREFLMFHPESDPAVTRVLRPNVTGLVVRRTGGRTLLGYTPKATLYALVASAVGALLLTLTPENIITVPDAPGSRQIETIVQTLGWAMGLLGRVLVFSGILAGLLAVVVLAHWLFSKEVSFVIERGDADPIECPTTRSTGTRALRELKRKGIG
jgi:hypothetical protein